MLKCWTREPHKRPSFQRIESCLEHLKSSPQGDQNALVYYNDDYRNSDISQGIVNQAFEGEKHERQKSDDDTETGVTLISVASGDGDGLHDVMYRPSPDTCSNVHTLEMRMSVLQDGAINYSYVTSAEDEESVLSIGCLAGQGDYDVHQNLPLNKKPAACAAPNSVNKEGGRYSLQRTSRFSTSFSQQIGNKSISSTSGPTEFQNSSSQLSLDNMTVPFLVYSTLQWEDTPTAPTKEKYNGNNDVVSCQASEVSNTFKCSKNSDGGLESKAEPEDNANSVVNGDITEEVTESQSNIMTAATNLEEPVSI